MLLRVVVVSAAMGLIGPLLRFSTWPPSAFEEVTSASTAQFVYDLVFYLWPAQPLASYESIIGPVMTGVLSIGGNVLFFACLGTLVGVLARSQAGSVLAYTGTFGVVGLMATWTSGFSLSHVNYLALLTALFSYGILVWLVKKVSSNRS